MTKPIKKSLRGKFDIDTILSCAGQKNWGHVVSVGYDGVRYVFKGDSYAGSFTIDELEAMSHATDFKIPEAHYREYHKGLMDGEEKKESVIRRLANENIQLRDELANSKAALDIMVKRNNEIEANYRNVQIREADLLSVISRLKGIVDMYIDGKLDGME
jgi:hypothetical protein